MTFDYFKSANHATNEEFGPNAPIDISLRNNKL